MREAPQESYYPRARVRLIVRFEEFGTAVAPEPPPKPPQLRRGAGSKGAEPPALQVVERDGALLLVATGDDPNRVGSPQQQAASSDNLTHVIDGVIPTRANLKRNGIRTASTLSLSLPFRDVPFDPRTLRSVAVQYFLGCVSAEDHARGVRGEQRANATPSGSLPFGMIPDEVIDSQGRPRSTLRFEGWVDEWEGAWADGDDAEVTVECTDNTRLLLEQDAPPRLTIDKGTEIDRAIADYLANFPQFRGLSVKYLPGIARDRIPKLETALGKGSFPPRLGPPPSGGGAGGKLKVWDYLTDVAGTVGHTVRMEGTTIIVQRPRTIYDGSFGGRADDPFAGRVLPSGRRLERRLYVYGHNIREMGITRKFATYTPRNVEVRSYDSVQKRTIVVRYPSKEDRQTRQIPGDAAESQWWVVPRPGLRDEKTARLVAQGIYEAQGRNELAVRVVTKSLASFGGGNLDPDALDMIPGDSVDIEVARTRELTQATAVSDVAEQVATRAVDFLRSLGYSAELAAAYARATEGVGLPTTFRVKALGIDWDAESEGVTIDIEAMNYIEVRADVDLPDDERITPSDVQSAAASGTAPASVEVDQDGGI